MKIIIDFNEENLKADVKIEKDLMEHICLGDAVPYIMDALYELLVKDNKENMLR